MGGRVIPFLGPAYSTYLSLILISVRESARTHVVKYSSLQSLGAESRVLMKIGKLGHEISAEISAKCRDMCTMRWRIILKNWSQFLRVGSGSGIGSPAIGLDAVTGID
jgi:hypothetical protein